MSQEWHYTRDKQRHGPVSTAQLRQLAASGNLSPTDKVWREGMERWIPAQSVKGLFPKPAAAPPPSPPVSANKARPAEEDVAEVDDSGDEEPAPRRRGRPAGGRKASMAVKLGVIGGGVAVLLLVATVVIIVFSGKPKPDNSVSPGGPISLTAAELIKEYHDSLDAYLDGEYKDKPTTIAGSVSEVRTGYVGTIGFAVKLADGRSGRIGCDFTDEKKAPLAQVQKGQQIAVRGVYRNHDFEGLYLFFRDCELVNPGTPQGGMSAEALVKGCRGRIEAVDKKYKGKLLRVRGVVKRIDLSGISRFPVVDLQSSTDSDDVVMCHFSLKDKDKIGQLQQGDEINLKGICEGAETLGVSMKDCELVNLPERLR